MGTVNKSNETNDANDTQKDRALIKRIWRDHTKKYFTALLGAMALTAIAAGLEAYSVSLLKPVFDEGFVASNHDILVVLCIQIVIIYFFKGWFAFFYSLVLNHVTRKTIQAIQFRVFSHLLTLDLKFFAKNSSGQMLSRIMGDCGAISQIAISFITSVFKDLVTCIAMFTLIVYFSWKLVIVILIFVPLGALAMRRIEKRVKEIARESAGEGAKLFAKISESLQSIKLIKSYNIERKEARFIKETFDKLFELSNKQVKNMSIVTPMVDMLTGLILAIIIIVGGYEISQNQLTTGDFVAFLGAWVAMYRPLKSLLHFRAQLKQAMIHAHRVYDIIDTKSEIKDKENAKRMRNIKGEITFENVFFEYNETKRALSNINLLIPAGKTVALVGKSGGGKSTLMSLVPRFYDPNAGVIKIDGEDIRDFTQESLRENIAFVSQEVILFDDTIAANIACGRGDLSDREPPTQSEIEAAAKAAAAHEFILATAEGYQTIVGERGVMLSGGQRQRVSIARAILKDAPILLLDEATSALDTESERAVQAALAELMKDRTTIVIAHRLSTIVGADMICVLDGGEIVERGTHEELLAKGGEYAKLHQLQGF
ncbi:MAG: ATP-binding cassette domain-containing protein [Helicobacteraceae bacterium]|jgi:subfamily B ATP-binding cassette protein MsbA|nr:ATP-binding cassette domain-containing protein [Helicobacteraceae bacterium]